MEDLSRIWLEGLQVFGCRPQNQEDVCPVPGLPMSGQIWHLLLGWIFGAVHMVSAQPRWLGVLCHMRRFSIVCRVTRRGPLGSATREQLDDGHFHVRLRRGSYLLCLQGELPWILSFVSLDTNFNGLFSSSMLSCLPLIPATLQGKSNTNLSLSLSQHSVSSTTLTTGSSGLIWELCAAVIAIVLLVVTMIYSVIVLRNFGRGLKTSSACITWPCPTVFSIRCALSD